MSKGDRPRLLVIGAGMAASRLLDELLALAPERFHITVVGAEPEGSYNRIMLSAVLADEATPGQIMVKDSAWFQAHGVRFIGGRRAVSVVPSQQCVHLDDGVSLEYDELVIATGSRPAAIAAEGQALAGVTGFRTLADTDELIRRGAGARRALVVGGGLLGLEAAYGLARRGLEVAVVHRGGWLMNRQLDPAAGDYLRRSLARLGITCYLDEEVEAFQGAGAVQSARLRSGAQVACDLAVISTGIQANFEWAREAGICGRRGIVVDDWLRTSAPAVSAVGECIEHRGETFGLVEPIFAQCRILAQRLAGRPAAAFVNKPVATKLKVSGVAVFSAGEVMPRPGLRELVFEQPEAGIYRKLLVADDGRLVGAVLLGDTRSGPRYFEWLEAGVAVGVPRHLLPLGEEFWPEVAA